jgi:hypothetical protein
MVDGDGLHHGDSPDNAFSPGLERFSEDVPFMPSILSSLRSSIAQNIVLDYHRDDRRMKTFLRVYFAQTFCFAQTRAMAVSMCTMSTSPESMSGKSRRPHVEPSPLQ